MPTSSNELERMMKIFKKQLTIKTRFNPSNIEDVEAFNNACEILEKEGIEFEKGNS